MVKLKSIGKEKENRTLIKNLATKINKVISAEELANRLIDQVMILKICRYQESKDLLTLGYDLVFHKNDTLSKYTGAHLSSPALLHKATGDGYFASTSPFNYSHYLNNTLGPALFVPVSSCVINNKNKIKRDLFIEAIKLLLNKDIFEKKSVPQMMKRISGDGFLKDYWSVGLSFDVKKINSNSPPLSSATVDAVELALKDDGYSCFTNKMRSDLFGWILSYSLNSNVSVSGGKRKLSL